MANIKKIREVLTKAIFEVLERAFFVFAEPVGVAGTAYQIRANIRFSGPMDGAMQISMSDNLANIMTKNMLNLQDVQATDPVIEDCVKECLNMICGSFVRKVDPDRVFQLTIPDFERISHRPDDQEARPESSFRLVFDTQGGAFEVVITAPGFL